MDREAQMAVIDSGWPAITDAELGEVATRLPQHTGTRPAAVTWRSSRPMTSAALAMLPDGTEVFVKRQLPSLVSRAELAAKHSFVNRLVQSGFPTVPQLVFDDGTTVLGLDDWFYEVSLRAPGEDRYRGLPSWEPPRTAAEALEVGRVAGRLRTAAEQIEAADLGPSPYQTRVRLMLGDPLPRAEAWLVDHPAVASHIERTGADFAADLALCAAPARRLAALAEAPMRWTHGDLHASNLLWRADQVSSVIDFGLACVNPPLVDLAMAIERHAIDWLRITAGDPDGARPLVAQQIIDGYVQCWPLSAKEAGILGELVAVVQAEFALTVIDYVQHAPVPKGNAAWSYDVYFAGHCRWFASDHGRRFIEQINTMATSVAEEE